ncbi:MAG: GWxTD domain-containing protein [Bacteroidetes bacterium]|nr:GWxTD domain-containing protein [Bacteroidota bacterium]
MGAMNARVLRAQDVVPDVSSAVMTRAERAEEALDALERGDYHLALAQADALLERWPRDETGLVVRAAVLLFGPEQDPLEAGRMLKRLPRERREDADVEALDLWKDFRHGFNFMPTVRERLQMERARDLLAQDPQDPLANLVAGMMRIEDQRYFDNAARVTTPFGEGEVTTQLFWASKAVIDQESGQIAFNSDHSGLSEILAIRDDQPMREASAEAVRFLIRAAASGPLHKVAVRYLTEAAIRGGRVRDAELLLSEYVARNPESAPGYLYLGLIHYMLQKDAQAERAFDRALALMTEEEQLPWRNPSSVVSTHDLPMYREAGMAELDEFWARQDREWSRPGNERLVEHMGRMVYADLIWGREDGLRGWQSEPGQVLIRYGFPRSRMQFQTEVTNGSGGSAAGGDRFYIMHYGSRYWIFQDLAKAGKPIFYSPPADFFQGGRARQATDWALVAREQFRDNPLVSDLDERGRLGMVLLPSVLEDNDGRTVVAPLCIRGAAFGKGAWIQAFQRPAGAPIPSQQDSVQVVRVGGCTSALAVLSTGVSAVQVSLEARQDGFWSVGRFDVAPGNDASTIRVSDLLVASLIEEADPGQTTPGHVLLRNGLFIHPVAEARFDRGAPLYLYAEAYGLDHREGDVLSVEAVLVEGNESDVAPSLLGRMFGRRDEAAVSVSFEDAISGRRMGRYLILETGDLQPGVYTLALRMTERSSGRQAVSRREIHID